MSQDKVSRIQQAHAPLIHQVVHACLDDAAHNQLDIMLEQALAHGWEELVVAIRRILNGERDQSLIHGLDEEDAIIIRSILDGLENPATLPEPEARADPSLAAPGLALLIHHARAGDAGAQQTLQSMAEQMHSVPGDMHHLSKAILTLTGTQWDTASLGSEMSTRGRNLLQEVLAELGKLARH